jgi:tRNA pseudouridine65 synthase
LSEADSQEDLLRQVQILYENPKLLVVFKPRGLMVHPNTHEPGAPNLEGILSGRLHQKIHGIHRLDRGTAGLMVYAKDKETCTAVSEQFAHRQVTKVYKAILSREIPEEILVDSPSAEQAQTPGRPGIHNHPAS